MGKGSPLNSRLNTFLQYFLPSFLAIFLAFSPLFTQAFITIANYQNLPIASQAVLDLAEKQEFDFQNRYLSGDIEFFYNQWIVSEPSEEQTSVSYETPGNWSRRSYDGLGTLTGSGYASYRYVITGLQPGTVLYAFRNIEVPNRIYLNGVLCSSIGQPSKESQVTFIDLSDEYVSPITVPVDGRVEYVMEVGNTGDGGAEHIGCVYAEGHTILDFSNRIIAPIALGFIIASMVTLVAFFALSQNRWRSLLLVGMTASTGLLYLFSQDTLFIGLSFVYSEPVFSSLMVAMYAGMVILMILYGLFRRPSKVNVNEGLALSVGAGICALLYSFLHGSAFGWVALTVLASFPLYIFIRNFVASSRGRPDPQFMILTGAVLGYGVMLPFFAANVFRMPLTSFPTIFAITMTVLIFACGFRDIYMTAVIKRDFAVLERRYRGISNRALAKLASEEETISTLSMIGESYRISTKEGDRRLLSFSTLMRRRLLALRQDKIAFSEECELESQLNDLHNATSKQEVVMVLDVEEGNMEVPPLIFETVIAELRSQIFEGEFMRLWESKKSVALFYPERCYVSDSAKQAILERCSLLGQSVRFRKGSILIDEGNAS